MSSTSMHRSLPASPMPRHRPGWKRTVGQAATGGLVAGLTSAVVLAVCGWIDARTTAGPLNGPSQWLFGRRSAARRRWAWRETGLGLLIHQLSALGWGLVHFGLVARPLPERAKVAAQVTRAAATGALAYAVDYKLTPQRLQPGFELQLRRGSLFAVYAAFAAGLLLVDLIDQRRRR